MHTENVLCNVAGRASGVLRLKVSGIYGIYTLEARPHRSASIFVSVTRTRAEQAPILNTAFEDRLIVKRRVGRSV